jgi:hypothetical protein
VKAEIRNDGMAVNYGGHLHVLSNAMFAVVGQSLKACEVVT